MLYEKITGNRHFAVVFFKCAYFYAVEWNLKIITAYTVTPLQAHYAPLLPFL